MSNAMIIKESNVTNRDLEELIGVSITETGSIIKGMMLFQNEIYSKCKQFKQRVMFNTLDSDELLELPCYYYSTTTVEGEGIKCGLDIDQVYSMIQTKYPDDFQPVHQILYKTITEKKTLNGELVSENTTDYTLNPNANYPDSDTISALTIKTTDTALLNDIASTDLRDDTIDSMLDEDITNIYQKISRAYNGIPAGNNINSNDNLDRKREKLKAIRDLTTIITIYRKGPIYMKLSDKNKDLISFLISILFKILKATKVYFNNDDPDSPYKIDNDTLLKDMYIDTIAANRRNDVPYILEYLKTKQGLSAIVDNDVLKVSIKN